MQMFRSNIPLQEVVRSKDNNLNIIRFVAASMVLASHSYALHSGDSATEPWRRTLGMSMGGVAVDIFFCVSGFLVAGSLMASQSAKDFLVARALRIYPGLWVALLLSVIILGIGESTESVAGFFSSLETWKYLAKNAIMLFGAAFQLPGVFEANPWKGSVNGSLWTLPFELRAYLVLLAIWFVASLLSRVINVNFAKACGVSAVAICGCAIFVFLVGRPDKFLSLLAIFLLGAICRIYCRWIVLDFWIASALVAILGAALTLSLKLFWPLYLISLPYLILCLVYMPDGFVREFNRLGDYSYGIYIYAFPVQQLLMAVWSSSIERFISASFVVTLVLSILSWHLVEKRALALRDRTRRP